MRVEPIDTVLPALSLSRSRRTTSLPGSYGWLLRHELRLAMRDWIRPGGEWRAAITALVLMAALHGFGWLVVQGASPHRLGQIIDDPILALLVGFGVISIFGMLAAQSMEAVTRAFYVRGDLELILSSPASARRLFVVRMAAITLTTMWLAGFLVLPVIDMLAILRDARWLTSYGLLLAMAALAQTFSLVVTVALFKWLGPKRTRLVAQVIGALIGATTVIGTQVPAILQSGSLSRLSLLTHPENFAWLPTPTSLLWLPARAAFGDWTALAILLALAAGAWATAVHLFSRDFASMVVAAAGVAETTRSSRQRRGFRRRLSPSSVLRLKELQLILRDPWLVSQSLMQILYLVPPAILLWRNFGESAGQLALRVPVVVLAASHLAGGLAWLAISAEDAPDLIATAPITGFTVMRIKIEAVLIAVGAALAPFILALAIAAPGLALIAILYSAIGIASNCTIQYLFRSQARRTQFRMRQRASRLATMCETLISISWAGAAGLTSAGTLGAIAPAIFALGLLGVCWIFRPARAV